MNENVNNIAKAAALAAVKAIVIELVMSLFKNNTAN